MCEQAALWEHGICCPQLNSQSKGNIAHIALLGALTFIAPGECREAPHAIESHRGSLPK